MCESYDPHRHTQSRLDTKAWSVLSLLWHEHEEFSNNLLNLFNDGRNKPGSAAASSFYRYSLLPPEQSLQH